MFSLMVICKAYQYKLLPTKEQSQMFAQWAGSCRYLFNLGLEHRRINWEAFKVSQTYASQCKELTQLKKEEEVQWLKDVPSQCLQQSLRRLDRAFQNFFEGLAKYPRYKRKNLNDSFCFPDPNQFSISNLGKKGYLKIPKAGRVKFVCSREEAFEGEVSNLTIRRDVDHWLVSIQCEVHVQDVEVIPEEDIGLDLGVIHTLTASNHQHIDLPTIQLKAIEGRIETLQKKISQQKQYGSNWRKTKAQIAKLYRRIRRIKGDFIQKTTTELVNTYGGIAVEDLNVKNMTASARGTLEEPGSQVVQKAGLNRSVLRASFGRILEALEYKCNWKGRLFVPVNPRNTSLECSRCHHIDAKNRKNQTEFLCVTCGLQEHADVNAAITIKYRAFGSAPWEPGKVPAEKAA